MITTTEQSEYTHTATWCESMPKRFARVHKVEEGEDRIVFHVTNAGIIPTPESACGTWIVMVGSGDEDKPVMSDLSPEERQGMILNHIWGER